MGGIGADAKTSISVVIIRYSVPPLVCYALVAEKNLEGWKRKILSTPLSSHIIDQE